MCQFTNLIHWLVLHSPLEITERHHHDGFDLFPDSGRTVPFGTGTSITYNYLDYRFRNPTDITFQLIVNTTDTHLCGQLLASRETDTAYRIYTEDERFEKTDCGFYRTGKVYREIISKSDEKIMSRELIQENYAKVMYDLILS